MAARINFSSCFSFHENSFIRSFPFILSSIFGQVYEKIIHTFVYIRYRKKKKKENYTTTNRASDYFFKYFRSMNRKKKKK